MQIDVPVGWAWDIVKIVIQSIFGGLSIGVGAWIAFRYAEAGRRNDVYYKKRFDTYQDASGVLLNINLKANNLFVILNAILNTPDLELALSEGRDKSIKKYVDSVSNILDEYSLSSIIVMPYEARKEYLDMIGSIGRHVGNLWFIDNRDKPFIDEDYIIKVVFEAHEAIVDFNVASDKWIAKYINYLDIPNVEVITKPNSRSNWYTRLVKRPK